MLWRRGGSSIAGLLWGLGWLTVCAVTATAVNLYCDKRWLRNTHTRARARARAYTYTHTHARARAHTHTHSTKEEFHLLCFLVLSTVEKCEHRFQTVANVKNILNISFRCSSFQRMRILFFYFFIFQSSGLECSVSVFHLDRQPVFKFFNFHSFPSHEWSPVGMLEPKVRSYRQAYSHIWFALFVACRIRGSNLNIILALFPSLTHCLHSQTSVW